MKINNKYYILTFSFLMRVEFYTPVFGAFLSNIHNFTNSQITILFAVFSVTTFIFEVPTGILGDILGERLSLILGSLLAAISTLLFLCSSIYLIFFAEILLAISGTFMSGSFESLIYKYCSISENELNCDQFVSRAYSLQWIALCFSFLGCFAFMNFVDLAKLFWFTLLFNLLALALAFKLPKTVHNSKKNGLTVFGDCLNKIISAKNVRLIFIYNLVMSSILVLGYQILQPYLNELNLNSTYNGLLYFAGALIASMGSEIFSRVSSKLSYKWIFCICISILFLAMLGFYLSYTSIILVAILLCLYRFTWGLTTPLLVVLSNKQLESDDFRNTFFSLISLFSNLLVGILLFVFGLAETKASINYGILGGITIIFAVFVLFSWKE